ncbi:MAG: hypothetical protein ACPGFA_03780 [Pikeienuella sp.]
MPLNSRYVISDGQSVVFDAVRIFATLAVFVQHATLSEVLYPHKVELLGRAVIPVFLLISGYMTAATMARGGKFFRKAARRYVKYYFVVVPAIFIMFAADQYLIAVDSPIVDRYKFHADHSPIAILREMFEALTFSGEYWRLDTVGQGLFGNVAYWTMDYIMAYVVITMAWYLTDGFARAAFIALAFLIAGPTVILLAPLWFVGVLAYELHRRCDVAATLEREGRFDEAAKWPHLIRRGAPLIAVTGAIMVIIVEYMGVGETAYLESKSWASYDLRQYLGMAKRFAWQWMLLPGLFLLMVASKYVVSWQPPEWMKYAARRTALYTLPIYIFHYSFIYVALSLIPNYDPSYTSIDPYLMMSMAIGLTVLFSWACFRFVQPVADRLIARVL